MGIVSELLTEELVDLACNDTLLSDFISRKSKVLLDLGFVEESYLEALMNREKEYPTGLELENIAIAIPHTTVEHIKKPFIYFNKLNTSDISFIQMGTDNVLVKPKYVLMLGIKNPKEQVSLLSELMDLFSNKLFVASIAESKTPDEVFENFKKY